MAVVKQLGKFGMYPLAMSAGVAFCLWVLLGPLRIDRLAAGGQSSTLAAPSFPELVRPSGRIASAMEHLPLKAGDGGPLVAQLQGALIKKGYSVGQVDADGILNSDTLAALGAFQDNQALPVRPSCDQRCWTALVLSRPE